MTKFHPDQPGSRNHHLSGYSNKPHASRFANSKLINLVKSCCKVHKDFSFFFFHLLFWKNFLKAFYYFHLDIFVRKTFLSSISKFFVVWKTWHKISLLLTVTHIFIHVSFIFYSCFSKRVTSKCADAQSKDSRSLGKCDLKFLIRLRGKWCNINSFANLL